MINLIPIRANSLLKNFNDNLQDILNNPHSYCYDGETFDDFLISSSLFSLRHISIFAFITVIFDKLDYVPPDFFSQNRDGQLGFSRTHYYKISDSFFRTDVPALLSTRYPSAIQNYFSFVENNFRPHNFSNHWVTPEITQIISLITSHRTLVDFYQNIHTFLSLTHPSRFDIIPAEHHSYQFYSHYIEHLFFFFLSPRIPHEVVSRFKELFLSITEHHNKYVVFKYLLKNSPLFPDDCKYEDENTTITAFLPELLECDYLCSLCFKENNAFLLSFCDVQRAINRSPQFFF